MDVTTVANGVGGSYTKWQGKPPAHKVIMAQHEDDQWTTVKVYDLTDRATTDSNLKIQNGAMGPKDKPFAHDIDFEELNEEQQERIKEHAIEEFSS